MAITIKRVGYGQVEANHLSAQRTSQIYAQLPAKKTIEVLHQGQFVKYDYPNHECNFTGKGEWMLVYNEIKLYRGLKDTYKDFALVKKDFDEGIMTPRVFKTNVGDIMTTNTIKDADKPEGVSVSVGDLLKVDETTGLLTTGGSVETDGMVWEVAEETTMPDMQPAVKIVRIK